MPPPRALTEEMIARVKAIYNEGVAPTRAELVVMCRSPERRTAILAGARPMQSELARLAQTSRTRICVIVGDKQYERVGAKPRPARYSKDGFVTVWEPAVPRPLAEFPSEVRFDSDPRAAADHGTARCQMPGPVTWALGGSSLADVAGRANDAA